MATKEQREKAWDNAKKIGGKDPEKYRQDPYGNSIYKASHGRSSEMGWQVDHIKPTSRGGSDATRNLQALNTKVNRAKSNTLVKKSRHSKSNK
ncbi:MAG: hypothetical protein DDT30_01786 [Dehalococcoidia bacterium]|nr:hypothetical protein [Bacillota bacterium]MBT9142969.1 hypothetical protein [Bacillota bacterium]